MVEVNILIAFGAGLLSFFAPCVVPLLPTYVAYVFGVSSNCEPEVGSVGIMEEEARKKGFQVLRAVMDYGGGTDVYVL